MQACITIRHCASDLVILNKVVFHIVSETASMLRDDWPIARSLTYLQYQTAIISNCETSLPCKRIMTIEFHVLVFRTERYNGLK